MSGAVVLPALADAIQGFSNHILDYALVLAAVGTVTMALIECVKAVTRGRLLFHRRMVGRWTGGDRSVMDQLLTLAVGDTTSASALYDQPSEKMLGQIQAAANVALDFPTVYGAFYAFLTTGSAPTEGETDSERWRRVAPRIARAIPGDGPAREQFEAESRQSTQARARLGNLVTRRLDAFQATIDYRWARMNQVLAVVGGAAFLLYVLPADVADGSGTMRHVPLDARLLMALIGGLVAPFAKDVVNALSGLKARR